MYTEKKIYIHVVCCFYTNFFLVSGSDSKNKIYPRYSYPQDTSKMPEI